MKVELNALKTIFISPCEGKYEQRCKTMLHLAKDMNASFELEKSGNSYPKSLNDAHTLVLKNNMNDSPVLLLEDDVRWDGTMSLNVPDDADAVYLGNSKCGNSFGWSAFERYDDTYFRVVTMQATHAILYISKRYKEAASKSIDADDIVLDVTLRKIQKNFRIYTRNTPVFYQADENAALTNLSVKSILDQKRSVFAIAFLACALLAALFLIMMRRS